MGGGINQIVFTRTGMVTEPIAIPSVLSPPGNGAQKGQVGEIAHRFSTLSARLQTCWLPGCLSRDGNGLDRLEDGSRCTRAE